MKTRQKIKARQGEKKKQKRESGNENGVGYDLSTSHCVPLTRPHAGMSCASLHSGKRLGYPIRHAQSIT